MRIYWATLRVSSLAPCQRIQQQSCRLSGRWHHVRGRYGWYASESCVQLRRGGGTVEGPIVRCRKRCVPGRYAPVAGADKCLECPPGSACPDYESSIYMPCTPGTYNSDTGKVSCLACPQGKYSPKNGSALCMNCPPGTYLNISGAKTETSCMKCSAGRYAPTNGSSTCLQCPSGHYQESPGQVECHECKSGDGQLMSNAPDFRSCVARSLSILGYLFKDNAAYYAAFMVSASFGIVCSLMYYERTVAIREQQESKETGIEDDKRHLAPLSLYQVVTIAPLPGYSFCSDIILIIGIMTEYPAVSAVMVVFRLLHAAATLFLLMVLFGSKSSKEYLSKHNYTFLREAASWSELFHYDFARINISITGVVLMLCVCDISLVQVLPWKSTKFYEESQGFPSKSLMRFALGTDMVQASVNALCSITFIGISLNKEGSSTNVAVQTFVGISIAASLATALTTIMLLILKERVLKTKIAARWEGNKGTRGSVQLSSGLFIMLLCYTPHRPIYDAERSTRRRQQVKARGCRNWKIRMHIWSMKEKHEGKPR